jgi:hypothetical protein
LIAYSRDLGQTGGMIRGALLIVTLLAGPAFAQGTVDRLKADLLAGNSATVTLGQWCAKEKLAAPPVIRAMRDKTEVQPSVETRALLKVGRDEPVRYRRVKLICGSHVLSEADNWYVPSRLTPAMNRVLDSGDTPFGAAVKALNFHRRTLDAREDTGPGTVLQVRALLLTRDETPFSLVVENYTADMINH